MSFTGIGIGRLAQQPELRQTQNGTSVCTFSIGSARPYVKQGEERKTDWIDVVVWGKTAEFVVKWFNKGQMIFVQGPIQTRTTEKNGVKRKYVEIFAEKVEFCGDKPQQTQSPAPPEQSSAPGPYTHSTAKSNDGFLVIPDEDDLPF